MTTILPVTIGTDDHDLVLISEGNFSSEYLVRSPTNEVRMKIRHSKEKATKGAVALDRHNVELSMTTFPSVTFPNGAFDQAYIVIRSNPNSDGASAVDIAKALCSVVAADAEAIVGWQSALGS